MTTKTHSSSTATLRRASRRVLALALLCASLFANAWAQTQKVVSHEVKKGETTEEIADKLVDAGLIRSKVNFLCQKLFYKKYLLPGEYTLNTAMTSKEILLILDDGPSS